MSIDNYYEGSDVVTMIDDLETLIDKLIKGDPSVAIDAAMRLNEYKFLLCQFTSHSLHMDGQHSWRFCTGWPWSHAKGPNVISAIRAAMSEVHREHQKREERNSVMSDGQTEACEGSPLVRSDAYYLTRIHDLTRLLRLVHQFAMALNADYRDSNLGREVTRVLDR